MVNTELRRVKSLRLRAPTDSSLRRGRILAEDALRTATLPGAIGGRVLVVRSLNLGIIRSRQSPASLALAIERSLYTLGSQAVYVEDPSAGASHAVYFKDATEPYVHLALRLARGRSAADWFWPLAVPFWHPAIARDEALRSLLGAAVQTQAGVAAAAALVRELIESQAIEPLLGALRWQEGPALLKACGWSAQTLPPALLEAHATLILKWMPSGWDAPLAVWINRWGAEDARSSWLAAIALVADNPARLQDQRLMLRAGQLIKLMIESEWASAAKRNRLQEQRAAPQAERPQLRSDDEDLRFNAQPISKPFASTLPETKAGDARPEREEPHSHEEMREEIFHQEASLPDSFPANLTEETRSTAPDFSQAQGDAVRGRVRAEESPRQSDYAGLFFLIPVLSRLGFSEMFERNPHLIEYHLPERFLAFVGKRLGISEDDPALSFLIAAARLNEAPAPSHVEFVAPAIWLKGLSRRGSMVFCRMQDEGGTRMLRDSSEKLTLALWRGRAPQSVRDLIGETSFKRSLAPQAEDLQVLLESLLTATRRWLRRFARIGLREAVSRPGRISETNTHIDVLLDLRQADVRVRRAGLDLNLGWVAWLGRVVTFYYL